jgi:Putative F0F1-ATPase subunit (ATPase_gene1).
MSGQKSSNSSEETKPQTNSNAVLILLGDIADTTWRMFVPTILFAVIGYQLDRLWHTNMIFAIIGVMFGALIAGLLVWKQLRKVKA